MGIIFSIIFIFAGLVFGTNAFIVFDKGSTSIHQIYGLLYIMNSVLCFGFGVLIGLAKENKVEK